MELLTGDKSSGQVAKVYGVHPNTVTTWKRTLGWIFLTWG